MPHLILEYTANIDQDVNFKEVFKTCHGILNKSAGIKIGNCKSRAIKLDNYYIAQGEIDDAFVHLDIRFLEGRSDELKKELGRQFLDFLQQIYAPTMAKYNVQITVEIGDIKKDAYFKFPAGSFTSTRQ